MPQGELKKKGSKNTKNAHKISKQKKNVKKGARYFAPRKAAAVKDHLANEGITKTINSRNERMAAGLASQQMGKLTITKSMGDEAVKELKEQKR
ncbi:leydig cell tumor protein [Schizosaccharomyces octosporus yFS286]|uniref:Leydig cell tumor protein n=1 Tax=Schizosaccharomyces octosporus (strain yFS286) TaxID=483514 RepID=S9PX77_SCHOY|nr:leydig cell tumor protein [Schizosaccharomyces octosporus yFS286]EPX72063.1 leydig cell tumor protein [Schizosaccharomyces octosporus yFS286]